MEFETTLNRPSVDDISVGKTLNSITSLLGRFEIADIFVVVPNGIRPDSYLFLFGRSFCHNL